MLGDVLHDLDVRPVVVVHDGNGLFSRIKAGFPRFVLLENCFWEQVTEEFVRRLTRRHPELRVVVWSAMPVKVVQAARYLYAGADGYFSLRGEEGNLSEILERIAMGKRYCPNEVREAMEKNGYEGRMVKGLTRRELEVVKLYMRFHYQNSHSPLLLIYPHFPFFLAIIFPSLTNPSSSYSPN
jgi:DNA-binding NarL/FixJ family response regulator